MRIFIVYNLVKFDRVLFFFKGFTIEFMSNGYTRDKTMIHELTAQNFDTTLDQHDTVAIDFWAPWCQPCLAFKPIFERVSEQFPKVCFASVNVEAEKELSQDFNIRQIPLIMILRQRVALFSEAGTLTQSALVDLVQQALNLDMSALERESKDDET